MKENPEENNNIDPEEEASSLFLSLSNLSQADSEYMNGLLENSMEKYRDVVKREMQDYPENLDGLQAVVSEYLDDFIILGHTPDDSRIILRYAPTPKGYDALKDLVRNYLVKIVTTGNLD